MPSYYGQHTSCRFFNNLIINFLQPKNTRKPSNSVQKCAEANGFGCKKSKAGVYFAPHSGNFTGFV